MIITILDKKYKCGSERGIGELVKPNILQTLNSIIDWDESRFPDDPSKEIIVEEDVTDLVNNQDPDDICGIVEGSIIHGLLDKGEEGYEIDIMGTGKFVYRGGRVYKQDVQYEQNRKYLGDTPELKPGNVILWDNQIISIDRPDRLILSLSESGSLALDRIYNEHILPEYIIKLGDEESMEVEIDSVSAINSTDNQNLTFESSQWVEISDKVNIDLWRKFLSMSPRMFEYLRKKDIPVLVDLQICSAIPCQVLFDSGLKTRIMFNGMDNINVDEFINYVFSQFINSLWEYLEKDQKEVDLV